MYTLTEIEPIIRAVLIDAFIESVDLEDLYDQFLDEAKRRNPDSVGFNNDWNDVLKSFILASVFGNNTESIMNRKKWESYLVLYENEMDSLSLIK